MSDRLIHQFGDADDILATLKTVNSAGSDIECVQKQFAGFVANSTKYPEGVVIAWLMCVKHIADYPGSVPMLHGMMHMDFEDYMHAILGDAPDGFENAVLDFYQRMANS